MAHPLRFDADDPLLARVRAIALALPGADEKISHGRPTFFTRKVFAIFGGVVKGDHGSDALRRALVVLPDAAERPALIADPRVVVPGYEGHRAGWLSTCAATRTGRRSPSSSRPRTASRHLPGSSPSSTRKPLDPRRSLGQDGRSWDISTSAPWASRCPTAAPCSAR